MGREAVVRAEVGAEAGEVKAVLESTELTLRGSIRRRLRRQDLETVHVDGDALCFTALGEQIRLHLGPAVAASWKKVIDTPPPSLRAKLGLDTGARALLVGTLDDAELSAALEGAVTDDEGDASMVVAVVHERADLDRALQVHAAVGPVPVWMVYPKGKGAGLGDAAIRADLRARGFSDTKSCAVSDRLTATRYSPTRP